MRLNVVSCDSVPCHLPPDVLVDPCGSYTLAMTEKQRYVDAASIVFVAPAAVVFEGDVMLPCGVGWGRMAVTLDDSSVSKVCRAVYIVCCDDVSPGDVWVSPVMVGNLGTDYSLTRSCFGLPCLTLRVELFSTHQLTARGVASATAAGPIPRASLALSHNLQPAGVVVLSEVCVAHRNAGINDVKPQASVVDESIRSFFRTPRPLREGDVICVPLCGQARHQPRVASKPGTARHVSIGHLFAHSREFESETLHSVMFFLVASVANKPQGVGTTAAAAPSKNPLSGAMKALPSGEDALGATPGQVYVDIDATELHLRGKRMTAIPDWMQCLSFFERVSSKRMPCAPGSPSSDSPSDAAETKLSRLWRGFLSDPYAIIGGMTCICVLYGARGSGKRRAVTAAARSVGLPVVEHNFPDFVGPTPKHTADTLYDRVLHSVMVQRPCVIHIRRVRFISAGGDGGGDGGGSSNPADDNAPIVEAFQKLFGAVTRQCVSASQSVLDRRRTKAVTKPTAAGTDAASASSATFRWIVQSATVKAPRVSASSAPPGSDVAPKASGPALPSTPLPVLLVVSAESQSDLSVALQSHFTHEVRAMLRDATAGLRLLHPTLTSCCLLSLPRSCKLCLQAPARACPWIGPRYPVCTGTISAAWQTQSAKFSTWYVRFGLPLGLIAHLSIDFLILNVNLQVQLPLEHPELFASGVRKRSGILLFGAVSVRVQLPLR